MALTQSSWDEKYVNGQYVIECTVISTTAETDAYTLRTPKGLDTTKPFTIFYSASGTPDAQALPMDLWYGFRDAFALSGQGASVVAASGCMWKQILDDAVTGVTTVKLGIVIDPAQAVADVVTIAAVATGLKTKGATAPYVVINLDGGSTLAAVTHTFTIVQDNGLKGVGGLD